MDNAEVARIFEEVADLLDMQNESPFRVRAYRSAARTIQTLGEPVASIVERRPKALTDLPGIGKDLAGKILEIVRTGRLAFLDELATHIPESLVTMMRIANIGPKRARLLYEKLGIRTLDDLERAAQAGRLRRVRGFGETLEAKILRGCHDHTNRVLRVPLAEAERQVGPLVRHLWAAPGVVSLEVAGSFRRRQETVGDLDILAGTKQPSELSRRFLAYPETTHVLAEGETKCSVILRSGIQVDLRIVAPETFGAALHYFTGSKSHNIAVRTLGVQRGLKISEYGVFRDDERVGGATEEEVFRSVDLPLIPPELRENRGEIEAAREGHLPKLVEIGDLRGDLHVHTADTDGAGDALDDLVEACADRHYEYVAITDYAGTSPRTGGFDAERSRRQARAIERAQRRWPGIRILRGAEVDILEDGRLDLDDEALSGLDVVVAAVRSNLDMDIRAMTERVLRAVRHPAVSILAHPTGRVFGRTGGYGIDLLSVAHAAREAGVLLEINSQPDRLDLDDVHARMVKDIGGLMAIDSGARRPADLDLVRYGIGQARRAWCAAPDIANTLPLRELLSLLRRQSRAHATRSPAMPRR